MLEALRQPLESGEVVINRSGGSAKFPAKFQLVLAANPCPCGNSFGTARSCRCSDQQKNLYMSKLSGPLLDRVDIRLSINAASPAQLAQARSQVAANPGTLGTSARLREVVADARARAGKRLKNTPWQINAQVPGAYLRRFLPLPAEVAAKLDGALARGRMSMRGYDRCLRLAWSIADLAGRDVPNQFDVSKAIFLRGYEDLSMFQNG